MSSSLTLGAGVSGRSDIFAEKGHHDRSQQKIAKLFSLVCFANCAVHIATIPPLYFCHFSCYGVVALLRRVSPVKLPFLGNISHITKRSSRKARVSYFAVIGCFSLDPQLFLVYCPVADSTSTAGYWTILVSWLWNKKKQLFLGFVITCVSWKTAEAIGQIDEQPEPQYQS